MQLEKSVPRVLGNYPPRVVHFRLMVDENRFGDRWTDRSAKYFVFNIVFQSNCYVL